MNREERPLAARCQNEGCPRPAEPGEAYCAACCLDRNLFRRDERRAEVPVPVPRERRAGQR
ncbi:MAG TPA: hypothetical protein VMH79_07125 [Thermoanaerobaculia bacterium]|nr:hypothetical protein [Thermoanaerobaculia bacterium]